MAGIDNEEKISALQVARIYVRNLIGTIPILLKINVGSILKYETQPTFTDPLDLVNLGYIGSIRPTPVAVPFTTASAYPFVIPNFSTTYAQYYHNAPTLLPLFTLYEDKGAAVNNPKNPELMSYDGVADTLTIDAGGPINGYVVISKL